MGENSSEVKYPEWMNETFFENVLKKADDLPGNVKVNEMIVLAGSTPGENFASIIYRIQLTYTLNNEEEIKTRSLIVKYLPKEGLLNGMINCAESFQVEMDIYTKIIPKFEKILRKHGDNTIFGAKLLYGSQEHGKTLIFEDLVELGYQDFVFSLRTDWQTETKLAIEAIAKWHALSFKVFKEDDEGLSNYQHGVFDMQGSRNNPIVTGGIDILIKHLRHQISTNANIDKEKNEVYVENLEKIKKKIYEKCYNSKSFKTQNNWLVLNHGDFHMKNLMFKYNENVNNNSNNNNNNANHKPLSIKVIDYQCCKFSSAAYDLIYVFYAICDFEYCIKRRDKLIHFYYENFVKTLKLIEYKGEYPKLIELHMDLMELRFMELVIAATFLPLGTATCEGVIKNFVGTTESRLSCYNTTECARRYQELLPIFLHKGYLEDNY